MKRRDFLILGAALTAGAASVADAAGWLRMPRSYEEKTADLLSELLFYDNKSPTLSEIESSLFIIRSKEEDKLRGRGVYLGGGYILTANHVVDEDPRTLEVVSQSRHGYVWNNEQPFWIAHRDSSVDLALLHAEYDDVTWHPQFNLSSRDPEIGEWVSMFVRPPFDGYTPDEAYSGTFSGVDFYERGNSVENLWSYERHPVEAFGGLDELKGFVMPVDNARIAPMYRGGVVLEHELLTTINHMGNGRDNSGGKSGSPVFQLEDGRWKLVGIMSKSFSLGNNYSDTTGHPSEYKAIQQSNAVIVGRSTIEKFLNDYLRTMRELSQ